MQVYHEGGLHYGDVHDKPIFSCSLPPTWSCLDPIKNEELWREVKWKQWPHSSDRRTATVWSVLRMEWKDITNTLLGTRRRGDPRKNGVIILGRIWTNTRCRNTWQTIIIGRASLRIGAWLNGWIQEWLIIGYENYKTITHTTEAGLTRSTGLPCDEHCQLYPRLANDWWKDKNDDDYM